MERKCVMFQGISGCGKGTQVSLLKEFLDNNTPHKTFVMEAGHGFRSFLSHDSHLAEVASKVTNSGGFQPTFMSVWNWVNIMINEMNADEHIIFDGSPRQISEPPIIDDLWEYMGHKDTVYVFYIKICDETVRKRLLLRGREDDVTEEAVTNRITNFKKASSKILKYYEEHPRYKVIELDGEKSPKDIHENIISHMDLKPVE